MDALLAANQTQQDRTGESRSQVSKPTFKFLIGFLAGFCAAIFPRLTALLLVGDGQDDLAIMTPGYLLCSTIFASLIGAVVMVMEWNVSKEPRATFMAALGIPAIITGSFNTIDGASSLEQQVQKNRELTQQIERAFEIDVIPPTRIEPLSSNDSYEKHGLPFPLGLIPEANAAEKSEIHYRPRFRVSPSIHPQEKRFVVVLDRRSTRHAAVARAKELNETMPARAIASERGFLIIQHASPTGRSEALLEAIRLRKEQRLNADVMELR